MLFGVYSGVIVFFLPMRWYLECTISINLENVCREKQVDSLEKKCPDFEQ